MIPSRLGLIVPRAKQSKKIFDGFGKDLVVRLHVLVVLKLCTSLISVCRKDDIEFKPCQQSAAVVDHDVREVHQFCTFHSNLAKSQTFNCMLP